MSRLIASSLERLQSAVSKISTYRSNSAVKSHAESTVKRGLDLSASFVPPTSSRQRRPSVVRYLSNTLQLSTVRLSGWVRKTTRTEKLIRAH